MTMDLSEVVEHWRAKPEADGDEAHRGESQRAHDMQARGPHEHTR
jgi:hypothetical protein